MEKYNIIIKVRKIFLLLFILLVTFISFNQLIVEKINAADQFTIIQDYTDESKSLNTTLYVGEKMDWDVVLDGVAQGGTEVNNFMWSSSNNAVAVLENQDGVVKGVSKGTAIITVKTQDGRTATATIRIKQPATSISLIGNETVFVGETKNLTATINPSTTDDKSNGVVWTSSDTNIASVNSSTGTILPKKSGVVTISATFTNNNRFTESSSPVLKTISATTNVTVLTKVTGVKLNKSALVIKKGNTGDFSALVYPTSASNKTVTWYGSNSAVFTINKGRVTSKKQGFGYIKVTTSDQKKSAYAPVSVYDSVSSISAYTKKTIYIRNGAHSTNKYVSNIKKINKDIKVIIYGQTGDFFYIKYGNTYGFVLKKDLIYMNISSPRLTVNKNIKKYPMIKVTAYNSTETPKFTNTNKVVLFKLKKNSKKTKKYKNGTSITTTIFYVIPKKEGRTNTIVKVKKASASYYVSSYTRIKNTEAFVRVKKSNMFKGANTSIPIRKSLNEKSKVIILATCTKNFFYIQHGNERGFVKVSDVVYIKASDSFNMYRYNNKSFNAYLVNSSDDSKIKWYTNNSKTAKVNKQVTLKNGKQAQVWAEKNGSVTLTAYYEYSKGKTIKTNTKVNIKNVKLEIYSVSGTQVGQTLQVKARIKNVTNPAPVIKFTSNNTSLFSKTYEKNNVGKFTVYGLGSGKITVKYRGLSASKTITTKPLLIYSTRTRPIKTRNGKSANDILYNNQTSKQIIKIKYISNALDYSGKRVKDRIIDWKLLCYATTMGDLQTNGLAMIDHFVKGSGKTYTNSELTKQARSHKNTVNYVNGVNKSFKTVIKQMNGNISKLKYTHNFDLDSIQRAKKYPLIKQMSNNNVGSIEFNLFDDYFKGLKFAINQVHASQVEVVSYKYDSRTGKYTAKLKHTLYDHFGLDIPDIDKFGYLAGFRGWYVLQHDKMYKGKYKPFITKIEFYETVSGTI